MKSSKISRAELDANFTSLWKAASTINSYAKIIADDITHFRVLSPILVNDYNKVVTAYIKLQAETIELMNQNTIAIYHDAITNN